MTMKMFALSVTSAALIALAGCATPQERQAAAQADADAATLNAAGTAYADGAALAGKSENCIQTRNIRSTKVRSDRVIDFEMQGGKTMRNVLPYSCPSLGFEERFAYTTSIAQLCSVDLITVLQAPGLSRGASCGLGAFQPIEKPRS
jgi:hypothetical protein